MKETSNYLLLNKNRTIFFRITKINRQTANIIFFWEYFNKLKTQICFLLLIVKKCFVNNINHQLYYTY